MSAASEARQCTVRSSSSSSSSLEWLLSSGDHRDAFWLLNGCQVSMSEAADEVKQVLPLCILQSARHYFLRLCYTHEAHLCRLISRHKWTRNCMPMKATAATTASAAAATYSHPVMTFIDGPHDTPLISNGFFRSFRMHPYAVHTDDSDEIL